MQTYGQTHEISNQFDELVDQPLYEQDAALKEAIQRAGAEWHAPALQAYGRQLGASFALGEEA
ncbi:MAG TPA: acyl-CoA dehydrogenase, partial [Burkholderiaceae bacterium]